MILNSKLLKNIMIRIIIYSFILFCVFVWIFSTVLIKPLRSKITMTPDMFSIPYENCLIKSTDGLELNSWWIENRKSRKCIILCHGFGTNKSDMVGFIPFLYKAGYNLLIFDFRGHGENKSKYTSLGYFEVNDLLGAVNFALKKKISSIGVLGISMGAASGIIAAVKSSDIKAVVSDSAYTDLNSIIRHYAKKFYHLPYFPMVPAVKFVAQLRIGAKYGNTNPLQNIRKLKIPVFIIHGEQDENIPVSNAKALYEAANDPKQLLVVKNAFHVESHSAAQKKYESEVIKFFNKYL